MLYLCQIFPQFVTLTVLDNVCHKAFDHTMLIANLTLLFLAVIAALKNLQGKIRNLEEERSAAEDNLKSLTTETNKYRDILQRDSEQKKPSQTTVSKHNQGQLQR